MKHLLVLCIVFYSASLYAQMLAPFTVPPARKSLAHHAMKPSQIMMQTNYYKRPFSVVHYNIFMDWRQLLSASNLNYPATTTLTIVVDSTGLNSLELDAINMVIDTIRVNGQAITPMQPDNTSETITVPLGISHQIGDTITLAIAYTHTNANERGLFYYPEGYFIGFGPLKDSIATPSPIAYTMSEPLDAHAWMPCLDLPYNKATSEIRVAVPDSFTVSSNGTLQSVTPLPGRGQLFYWAENEPLASYLMCASASLFAHWSANYTRISNGDTVPIRYYVWNEDSTNVDTSVYHYNAMHAFRNMPQIMHGFSALYGEFPFTKYGMTAVEPFNEGGMEHQTMTTIIRAWLRGSNGEQGMAHEMTHQWFGDNVTCATWKDIWLNEGFATFGEDLYNEFMFGEAAYKNSVTTQVGNYLSSQSDYNVAIYDPAGQGVDIFNEGTTYLKGGVVLYMLRCMLGDSMYFAACRSYLAQYHYSAATTDQFADAISTATGQDLHWFINEWIYGKSQPLYNVTWWKTAQRTNQYALHVRIDQPDTTRQLFKMPIPLQVTTTSGYTTEIAFDSLRSQEFVFPFSSQVTNFAFDSSYCVLKDQSSSVVTGVQENVAAQSPTLMLAVAPNPARDNVLLMFDYPMGQHALLEVSDILGRRVALLQPDARMSGSIEWNVQSLPAGEYIARLVVGSSSATCRIEVVK